MTFQPSYVADPSIRFAGLPVQCTPFIPAYKTLIVGEYLFFGQETEWQRTLRHVRRDARRIVLDGLAEYVTPDIEGWAYGLDFLDQLFDSGATR